MELRMVGEWELMSVQMKGESTVGWWVGPWVHRRAVQTVAESGQPMVDPTVATLVATLVGLLVPAMVAAKVARMACPLVDWTESMMGLSRAVS